MILGPVAACGWEHIYDYFFFLVQLNISLHFTSFRRLRLSQIWWSCNVRPNIHSCCYFFYYSPHVQTLIEGFCQCNAHFQHFHFFIQKTCGGAGNVNHSNKSVGHQEPAYLARCLQLSTRILRFSWCALLDLTKAEIRNKALNQHLAWSVNWPFGGISAPKLWHHNLFWLTFSEKWSKQNK